MNNVLKILNHRIEECVINEFPKIVFSFSSRSIYNIENLFYSYQNFLINHSILISLYDLHYTFNKEKFYEIIQNFKNEVFLDSGVFEAQKTINPSNIYIYNYQGKSWDREIYDNYLKSIKNRVKNPYIVNFDTYNDLESQVANSNTYFSEFDSELKKILLIHPEIGEWNKKDVIKLIKLLFNSERYFNILGITEKELGLTFQQKISNIFLFRKTLDELFEGYVPIHIFGCSDPRGIVSYFLSGGDIFDGLGWIRFYFNRHSSYYKNEFYYDLLNGKTWNNDIILHNIQYLNTLSKDLNYSIINNDFDDFLEELKVVETILRQNYYI